MNIFDVKKLLKPLYQRIMLSIARAVIDEIKTGDKFQAGKVGLFSDEVREEIDQMQEYGFCSRAKNGADAIVVFVGGNRDNGVIIATEDSRYRVTLEEGEVAIYTDEGDYIHFKRNNEIAVSTKKLTITVDGDAEITATNVNLTADKFAVNGTSLEVT